MKTAPLLPFKLIIIAIAVSASLAVAKADDIADAKTAFATMLAYQKTDDPRSLDLFAPDCAVTMTLTDGAQTRNGTIPSDAFRELLSRELAKKQGNKDTYEDVKYLQEGTTVRVVSTVLFASNGKREPFSLVYERDKSGVLKIKSMHITNFVDASTGH